MSKNYPVVKSSNILLLIPLFCTAEEAAAMHLQAYPAPCCITTTPFKSQTSDVVSLSHSLALQVSYDIRTYWQLRWMKRKKKSLSQQVWKRTSNLVCSFLIKRQFTQSTCWLHHLTHV